MENEDKTVWNVPVGNSPSRGPIDAPVTLVIFSDYECPFCKRVEPTISRAFKDYEGKLRVVWKDRPLPSHRRAVPAALFALEAREQKGDKGFWAAHDMLFENHPKFEDANFEEYAKRLGLRWPAVKNAIENKTHSASIKDDMALADSVKATGTPHMFINGRRLAGSQPIQEFKVIIDEELKKAEALIKVREPTSSQKLSHQTKAKLGEDDDVIRPSKDDSSIILPVLVFGILAASVGYLILSPKTKRTG